MKRDYLKAGAMVAALTTMAPAEYQLGHACGFGHLAAGLPASLDIYTLRAIRTGRDVPAVALVMIAVNAASHLIVARHLAVTWYLIVAVSALPVLVLVRVERLGKGLAETGTIVPEPEAFSSESLPEPAAVPAEPTPEPVTLERAPEPISLDVIQSGPPTFGPLVPVAELLAGTSREQVRSTQTVTSVTVAEPAEPAPVVPEPEPEPQHGSADPDPIPPGVSADHIKAVREWLAAEPELTGTAIGTRLGKSDSYGRRVRRAAMGATS